MSVCAPLGILALAACGGSMSERGSGTAGAVDPPSEAGGNTSRSGSPVSIAALRERTYRGGPVEMVRELGGVEGYRRALIAYPSGPLRLTGVMTVPPGDGPFPVLLLNHGDILPEHYTTGDGTEDAADFLTRAGYLTLAADYRGYAGTPLKVEDPHLIHHRPEFAIDVLELLASVPTIKAADRKRIGLWGHSLGAETGLRVLEADRNRLIKAAVLWAPSAPDVNANNAFYTPAETPPLPEPLNRALSPLYHVEHVGAPISLHQAEADTEVKPEWSVQIRDALRAAGKTVEFFSYPGEDHNFRAGGWADITQRTITFFNTHVRATVAR